MYRIHALHGANNIYIYIHIYIYIDTHISLYNIYIYILLRTHAGDGTFEPAFASHLLGSLGRGASSCKELQEAAAAVVVESGGSCSGLVIFQQHVFLYFATSNLLVFWGVYQSNIGPKYTPYVKPTSFKFSCAIAQKKHQAEESLLVDDHLFNLVQSCSTP